MSNGLYFFKDAESEILGGGEDPYLVPLIQKQLFHDVSLVPQGQSK